MKHYILYYHGGSSNHGCEALVRTTAELLDYKNNKITLCSFRPEDDKTYGIDQFCDIHQMYEMESVNRLNPKWIKAYAELKVKHNPYALDDLMMLEFEFRLMMIVYLYHLRNLCLHASLHRFYYLVFELLCLLFRRNLFLILSRI